MGVFTTGEGGFFAIVGFTTGLILPYLDIVFVGLHNLLRVRINYYACGWFITRADDLLRVLPASRTPTAPFRLHFLPPTAPLFWYDLVLFKKIVLMF